MAIIFVRTLIIYISVLLALRFMGKRQLGELAPHELVITILISSVATIPLQSNSTPLFSSIIPIALLVSFEILQSVLSMKSVKFRWIMQGHPLYIIKNGTLQQRALKKLRLTMEDIVDAARQQGIFDISEIENAIVETNGSLSIQKKSEYDFVTPKDLNIKSETPVVPITIIMDGQKIKQYIKGETINDDEIEILIKYNNIDISKTMYMSIDDNGNELIIKKEI